jgi:hypothetical protein
MSVRRGAAWIGTVCVAGLAFAAIAPAASADVTKQQAKDSWKQDLCEEDFFTVRIDDMAFGDFTGDGRVDAVAVWTCHPPAGNLRRTGVTYWVDGKRIKQRHLDLTLTGVSKVKIKGERVVVLGSEFDPKPDQPYWMDPAKAKVTLTWNGKALV